MCGGTIVNPTTSAISSGLSPRVRGNRLAGAGPPRCNRSIPACAGEPPGGASGRPLHRVYPRVCGGTGMSGRRPAQSEGLSPRVRGNLPHTVGRDASARSIPACAGEPYRLRGRLNTDRVYPRVCGGTVCIRILAMPTCGLSPRVRGNQGNSSSLNSRPGSIPACAGEPFSNRSIFHVASVYPRVCGGTAESSCRRYRADGLSPRVRGNPGNSRNDHPGPRSIPACAGEPSRPGVASADSRVYPRVCGGTPPQPLSYAPLLRSIPACAGEPLVCAAVYSV